ncbi:hypothetical protein LTR84_006179 [Exophiala bonariae]|uniref:Uncharacterized protein n=1 Tax=Exophiala bonariae TaxID=1690606 RepID=A0AAV9N1S1_9EURO|nr:hypothetical protein LTR84_006179 [Exophiala bonariae]
MAQSLNAQVAFFEEAASNPFLVMGLVVTFSLLARYYELLAGTSLIISRLLWLFVVIVAWLIFMVLMIIVSTVVIPLHCVANAVWKKGAGIANGCDKHRQEPASNGDKLWREGFSEGSSSSDEFLKFSKLPKSPNFPDFPDFERACI